MEKEPITIQGFEKLKEELEEIKKIKRPKIIEAIAEARGHGDLSENAEYQYAKEEQSLIEGKISELESVISNAQIINISKLTGKEIKFGAVVKIKEEESGKESIYQLVGEYESDIKNKKIQVLPSYLRKFPDDYNIFQKILFLIFIIFFGEIKKTIEQFNFDIELNNLIISDFLYFNKPIIYENNGSTQPMTPNDARLRNFTYSAPMNVDIEFKVNVKKNKYLYLSTTGMEHDLLKKSEYISKGASIVRDIDFRNFLADIIWSIEYRIDAPISIIILNGHHGNAQILGLVKDAWGVLSYWHFMKHEFDHAGFVETSIMLAISDKVKMKKAKKGLITKGLSKEEKERISKLSTQPGGFPKVAKNGVWGDPTGATKKDGEKFLAEIVRNLAKECQT